MTKQEDKRMAAILLILLGFSLVAFISNTSENKYKILASLLYLVVVSIFLILNRDSIVGLTKKIGDKN